MEEYTQSYMNGYESLKNNYIVASYTCIRRSILSVNNIEEEEEGGDRTEVQVSCDKCNYRKSSDVPSFDRLFSAMRKVGHSTCYQTC